MEHQFCFDCFLVGSIACILCSIFCWIFLFSIDESFIGYAIGSLIFFHLLTICCIVSAYHLYKKIQIALRESPYTITIEPVPVPKRSNIKKTQVVPTNVDFDSF
jgi:putative effector of murein hydrolase